MNTKQTPVVVAVALDTKAMNATRECGKRYAANQFERVSIAQDFARALGTSPSFAQWEAARVEWVGGYAANNPENGGSAADTAWARFAALLKELFALEKPKATSEAATKKANQRKAAQEKLLEQYAEKETAEVEAELQAAYEVLAKKPIDKDAKKSVAELEKVLKVKTAEETAEVAELLKSLRADIIKAVRECDDTDKLGSVLALMNE